MNAYKNVKFNNEIIGLGLAQGLAHGPMGRIARFPRIPRNIQIFRTPQIPWIPTIPKVLSILLGIRFRGIPKDSKRFLRIPSDS